MNNYKEWIIRYHGSLESLFNELLIPYEAINEKYGIIRATNEEVEHSSRKMQIEYIEESKPIQEVDDFKGGNKINKKAKSNHNLCGEGVVVGWVSHKANIDYRDYIKENGKSRILHLHDGKKEYEGDKLIDMSVDKPSAMGMCVGNQGIAPASQIIIVNIMKDKCYTADLIRAVSYIVSRSNCKNKPLVIYLPFDIRGKNDKEFSLVREVISSKILEGKVSIVSCLMEENEFIAANISQNISPIYTNRGWLSVGTISLLMEWGIVKGNNPDLYGEKLRTHYIKHMACHTQKSASIKCCKEDILDGLLKGLTIESDMKDCRSLDIAYEFIPEDERIDVFIIYNNLKQYFSSVPVDHNGIYPLLFPYFGIRGTVADIKNIIGDNIEPFITGYLAHVLSNEPFEIKPFNFKRADILNYNTGHDGTNTLIGIVDSGIDYTNPAFIDSDGKTRIVSIWDQTIEGDSDYGYGTVYDEKMINEALQSSNPYKIVPHKDTRGSGTILAGIAAGYSHEEGITYKGMATGAKIVVVKPSPAPKAMQELYHGNYNPLAVSALDIARGLEFLTDIANEYQMPISICLPQGTNSGSHDGNAVLDSIVTNYGEKPGVSMIIAAGEEADKKHHAMGNLKDKNEQEVRLEISEGETAFMVEIWAMFGDRIEVTLNPPQIKDEGNIEIFLNEAQTYSLSNTSSVWSQGSKIDSETGCQVIRFRLENPVEGEWLIGIKGIVIIEGRYDIWLPKAGMIMPATILKPSDPFTTIYNTSTAEVITIASYNNKSFSLTPGSGRGFTRDNRVKPDFMVQSTNIPGPLPNREWGIVSGTAVGSAIVTGITSHVYEHQLKAGKEIANTVTMRAILVEEVTREPTLTYPNPLRGYGLLDIDPMID
ncbi:MAG: S8 family serine peptidase [Epulopiscium sp.]|nr:S8 family serine peptidase [Candidatus Epulonipiscium sp.]